MLKPESKNPPAKIKDSGVIGLALAGGAAYNAKGGELLLLPLAELERRRLAVEIRAALHGKLGAQPVDCGSDAAIYSLAERYAREHGALALSFSEERGRDVVALGWSDSAAAADQCAADLVEACKNALGGRASIVNILTEATGDCDKKYTAVVPAADGSPDSFGLREGFICPACGMLALPDSPMYFDGVQPGEDESPEPLEDIETPGANTIVDLCNQLGLPIERTVKAMLYVAGEGASRRVVAVFVRGERNVSMNKLAAYLRGEHNIPSFRTAAITELKELIGEVAGYCGPVGMPESVLVISDDSVVGAVNVVVGANRPGYHKKGCCWGRDFTSHVADIAQWKEGAMCSCGTAVVPALLREIAFGAAMRAGDGDASSIKKLAYRDREGAHEYPAVWRGAFSLEHYLLAMYE